MALFETEHFGKPISAELSKYLLTYTNKADRAQVAIDTSVGLSTIRDVVYRSNTLTQKNSEGIVELMRIAVHNCTRRIRHAKKTKQQLNTMLEK